MKHFTGILWPVVPFTERDVDDALDHSFPASDPPPWTTSGAEAAPVVPASPASTAPPREGALTTAFRWARLTLGAAILVLLVPLYIVLLPLALLYRLVLELTGWPNWLRASPVLAQRRASTQDVLTGV